MTAAAADRDRSEVIGILDRCAEAIDRGRWEILEEIFTAAVVWVWPDGSETAGRDEVVGEVRRKLRHAGPIHNIFGSYQVAIDGDAATAEVRRRTYFADRFDRGRFMESLGTFEIRLERAEGRWAIGHFRETVMIRRGGVDVLEPPAGAA